jgi:phosphate transport system substrate-binding protein
MDAPASGESVAISIDGSSTVYPIAQSMAEDLGSDTVKVTVANSGTSAGFKKFVSNESDIATASRPITKEEADEAAKNKVEFIEIPVAFDGITIVVNKDNTAISDITIAELKKLWEPESKVKTWADLRPGLPAEEIKMYGPGTESGTFEYFTEAAVGKKKASRSDYTASADDNVLVKGVQGDKNAIGYFGFAYYSENPGAIKALTVDGVAPSLDSINSGTYGKLARPLFLYVKKSSLDKPAIAKFITDAMAESAIVQTVKDAGYVPLPAEVYAIVNKHIAERVTGSKFMDAKPGMKIADVLAAEQK